mmetsp:Transcript_8225/g.14103  ORF Transcript_8225/g.14103 Transcript_8225/m.14103 type:complete len:514 (-) Transcript_8225:681-2222(-)|eukprot:CAMPEP_0119105990 /NCGR_PEP_ID=MMETSP1180-20130426/3805_1 /TAXON_ID=3052 ORGANISM="Chlamydomonas cf sp, Strain CCMP681" /NCGR_SAMPLE_ID=MMETSP1180 /ASSEMBLY_ACC=CAM_ASM_000741 /LENGTH=513 /DNA_ID=CAMNT_0007091199 /DNA_START=99 /DNA_END=1640 /DNA_ORIENTATION=-
MVVLAASVLAKSGKPLVSRQYMDMSRIRIEGLLAAFPKLVGSGKQHTYVETENVRYVYQPMENLFLVLITNKQSNILEDLDTLRVLSKLVPEFCGQSLEEDAVCEHAFDLIFAFDEVISLGNKENITILQVRQNCEMESHEEKLHKMIIQSKINDTKDIMKKRANEIEKSKMETKAKASSMLPANVTGFGSKGSGAISGPGDSVTMMDSFSRPEPSVAKPIASKGPSKGMQLGKAKKAGNDFLESLAKEGEAVEIERPVVRSGGPTATVMSHISAEPVTLNIDEKLNVQLNKQGGLENLEVTGTLSLVVNNEEDGYMRVAVAAGANKQFQFKTHPNIDKAAYSSQNVLCLKDASRPFPPGSELGILKWRMQSKDESLVPLTINCWPSVSGGQSFVNIEYESTSSFDLQHVSITIPVPRGPPTVNSCDGEWRFDSRQSALVWTIELVDDTNRSGSMEFVVGATDSDNFYPVDISFSSNKTFCDMAVETVTHTQSGNPVKYSSKRVLATSEYSVA